MRARVVVPAVIAGVSLVGLIVFGTMWLRARNHDGPAPLTFAATTRAQPPFVAFDEARVAVDHRCLRVLVARSLDQRVQGLRDVRSLAPYDGMLFVFPSDSDARFTMASTPLPLDITFYDRNGAPVDEQRMKPCPGGSDSSCPAYASKARYRYALERPAGSGSSGPVTACA